MTGLVCDDCRKEKDDVHETICPFVEEIFGDVENCTLCSDCEYNRAMDI